MVYDVKFINDILYFLYFVINWKTHSNILVNFVFLLWWFIYI